MRKHTGFTLIEITVVLVIVGLILGGVLMGRDLIMAAQNRALISQIDKYNAAAYTFSDKYGGLPGDLSVDLANPAGFTPRRGDRGMGNGDGIMEGCSGYNECRIPDPNLAFGGAGAYGENGVFWVDLTTANGQNLNLISGSFSRANFPIDTPDPPVNSALEDVPAYLPRAKIGKNNFVYIFSDDSINYFGIAAVRSVNSPYGGLLQADVGLTVIQAYQIDQKIDDALAKSGSVLARFMREDGVKWANEDTTPPGVHSCFNDTTGAYYIGDNGGKYIECALAIQFQ